MSFISSIYAKTNAITTNETEVAETVEFIEETVDVKTVSSKDNIIFDNYDEVYIKNHDNVDISEVHFFGNVHIRFGDNTLKARKVIVIIKEKKVLEISAYDRVEFRYGKDIYLADELTFDPNKHRGTLRNLRSFMKGGEGGGATPFQSSQGWYYKAKKGTILSQTKIVLEDVHFSTSDEKYPHYSLFAKRLWYNKGEIIFAWGVTYTVAEADFFWFPFFFSLERWTGIKTAFGQEKHIGWYMMNSFSFNDKRGGHYDMGVDFYERLGEYAQIKYSVKKPIDLIKSLSISAEIADDIRILKKGDRYSHLINPFGDTNYQTIRQLSWHWKLNMSVGTKIYNATLNFENLNDPFFLTKYQQRRQEIDLQRDFLQPEENSFYGYSGDSSPGNKPPSSGFSRGFSIKAGKANEFSMSGTWNYSREINTSVSNIYLNERYRYDIRSLNFPNISYSIPAITIFKDFSHKIPQSRNIAIYKTNYTIDLNEDIAPYIKDTNETTNILQTNQLTNTLQTNQLTNTSQTNQLTNTYTISTNTNTIKFKGGTSNRIVIITNAPKAPVKKKETAPKYKITTNSYVLYTFNSSISPINFNYKASESVDTNGDPTSDQYDHYESGGLSVNGALLNNLINLSSGMSFSYRKRWSSFENVRNNNEQYSGGILNLRTSESIGKTATIFPKRFMETTFPFSLSHNFNVEVANSTYKTTPRAFSHSAGASIGFNTLKNRFTFKISSSYSTAYRITNEFEFMDTLDMKYIDNRISEGLSFTPITVTFFWFTFSTGVSFDILSTTNDTMEWDFDGLTNRLKGKPMLTVSFRPDSDLKKIGIPFPSIEANYTYNILEETNVSFDVSASYSIKNITLPFIYEITTMNFDAKYNHDFLNPKSRYFSFTFSTSMFITKYWKLSFSTSVKNNKIYRYYREYAELYNEPYVEFGQDLLDSINIFDYDALKRGLFKIQGLAFDLTHYLDEWNMSLKFNIHRRTDPIKRIAYWEPEIRIEFVLTGTDEKFPPYTKKFVPEEYQ